LYLNIVESGAGVKGHVPLRTCLGCGAVRPKRELLRIACNRQHEIVIDPQARMPGRGAYVCRRLECAELLRKKKALQRSFRQIVPAEVYQRVIDYFHEHNS
jgi:hypothetical protein